MPAIYLFSPTLLVAETRHNWQASKMVNLFYKTMKIWQLYRNSHRLQLLSLYVCEVIGAFCCWQPAKLADNKTQVLSFRTLCEESLIEIFPSFSRQNDKVVWFCI